MELQYRESEVKLLSRQVWMSCQQRSRMALVRGRRGAGKTAVVNAAMGDGPFLYFNFSGRPEQLLFEDFRQQLRVKYEVFVPSKVVNLETLFEFIFDISHKKPLNLVLDDCDGFFAAREDFAAFLSELWKDNRSGTHVFMVLIFENSALVDALFQREDSPLLNCPDVTVPVRCFTPAQLKSLLLAKDPARTSEDLLALYMATGGAPGLVMAALERTDATRSGIYAYMLSESSPLHLAAVSRLSGALGKNSEIYMAILYLIACGVTSQPEMEERLGGTGIGGHLARLETDYQLVSKMRPVLAGAQSRNVVRYCISDQYMLFWLKYMEANRSTFMLGKYSDILSWAAADFEQAGREALVRYFMEKFSEENDIVRIGGDWPGSRPAKEFSRKKEFYKAKTRTAKRKPAAPAQHEIDIVAMEEKKGKALVADVCLEASDFKKGPFLDRLATLKKGPLKGYIIDSRVFTLEDM